MSPKGIPVLIKHNIIDRNEIIILNVIPHLFSLFKNSLPSDPNGRIVKVNQRFVILFPFSINFNVILSLLSISLLDSWVKQNILMRLVKVTLYRCIIIILLMLLKFLNLRVHYIEMVNRYLIKLSSMTINTHKHIISTMILQYQVKIILFLITNPLVMLLKPRKLIKLLIESIKIQLCVPKIQRLFDCLVFLSILTILQDLLYLHVNLGLYGVDLLEYSEFLRSECQWGHGWLCE